MIPPTPAGTLSILLVDDNPGDIDLIRAALRRSNLSVQIETARDGVEAIAALDRAKATEDHFSLDLVLLDLNLPRKNGHEVLRTLRRDADPRVQCLPVIVLTSSHAVEDVLASYDLKADRYLLKPDCLDQFRELIQSIVEVCFGTNLLDQQIER